MLARFTAAMTEPSLESLFIVDFGIHVEIGYL